MSSCIQQTSHPETLFQKRNLFKEETSNSSRTSSWTTWYHLGYVILIYISIEFWGYWHTYSLSLYRKFVSVVNIDVFSKLFSNTCFVVYYSIFHLICCVCLSWSIYVESTRSSPNIVEDLYHPFSPFYSLLQSLLLLWF